MTIFYLIRHPESDMNLNHAHLIGGRSNHTPVSDNGLIQTEKLAKRLQREEIKFDGWYSSPAVRTMRGAHITRDLIDPKAEITFDDRLQELHQGDWEGRLRSEIFTPETLKVINDTVPHFKAPNGESQLEKGESMITFINELLNDELEKSYVIFTHGVAIKCLLSVVYQWKSSMTYTTAIENTSITQIRFKDKQWWIDRINDHAHLTMAA